MSRRAAFWLVYALLLTATTLVGAEIVAWLVTPAWPGYLLRPAPVSASAMAQWSGGMPDVVFATNSWLMRDRERSIERPADVRFRSVFVGDSFLEGGFTRAALPARIEGRLVGLGQEGVEAINLGVSGTSPIEYFYRIREVALRLKPDLVVVTLYSGNDIVSQPFPRNDAAPFLAELPRPSRLASVAPHIAWQAVNALKLSGAAAGGKYAPHEHETIMGALARTRAEGLPILTKLMHTYYFPELEERTVEEILARGGDRFWSEFAPRRFDREYLQGWILNGLIGMETTPQKLAMTKAEADAAVSREDIAATMSWLTETHSLVRSSGALFLVAVIPVANVDPDFVDFWRPWPRYYSYTLSGAAQHDAIVAALAKSSVPFVDLQPALDGVRGTYRKTDLHWTERGHETVAERLVREIIVPR
jgi:hypothetical protein